MGNKHTIKVVGTYKDKKTKQTKTEVLYKGKNLLASLEVLYKNANLKIYKWIDLDWRGYELTWSGNDKLKRASTYSDLL